MNGDTPLTSLEFSQVLTEAYGRLPYRCPIIYDRPGDYVTMLVNDGVKANTIVIYASGRNGCTYLNGQTSINVELPDLGACQTFVKEAVEMANLSPAVNGPCV